VRNLYTRAVEIVGNEWEIGILIVEMDYFNGIKDKNKFDGLLKNILNASAYPLYIMEEIGIAYENNKEFETAMYYYILQETMVFVERKDTYVKFDKLVEDIPEKYQLNFLYNIQQDANKGNLQAMYILAHIYRYDYILKKNDDVIAEQWFSKANRQANGQLMNGNAIFYSNIYGCPISTLNSFINYAKLNNYSSKTYVDFILAQREENISKRAELMRELAEVYNIVEAQTYLGRLYLSDYLGEPNYIEAVFWFKKAAQQGDENGQFYLAYCYLDGLGLEVNTKEGIRLLEQAIEKKQKYALGMLGEIYLEGKYGVEKNETKALDFLKQAALQGDADAAYSVARLYKYSTSSTQNKNEAVKWYIKAAEMGNMNGQTEIAEMYLRGEGVTKNIQESIKWYEKATEQSDSEKSAFWAELRLGELYEEGEVVPRDIQTAMKWYRKGANQNEINCIYRLAKLLYNDNNHKESFVWFKIAAEKTLAPAQYTLGQMYLKGLGTEKNKSEAIKWYKKAANQGEEKAKEALKRLGY
jgi:TPR repeat protein